MLLTFRLPVVLLCSVPFGLCSTIQHKPVVTNTFSFTFNPSDGTYNLIDDRGSAVPWAGGISVDLNAMLATVH